MKKKKDERRREKKAEAAKGYSSGNLKIILSYQGLCGLFLAENGFQASCASELTPEKFHDLLSLASSPSLLESVTLSMANHSGKSIQPTESSSVSPENTIGSTPPTPSFAQVCGILAFVGDQ